MQVGNSLIKVLGQFAELISAGYLYFSVKLTVCKLLGGTGVGAAANKGGLFDHKDALFNLIGGIAFFIIVHPWPLTVDLPLSGWLAVAGMIMIGTVIAYPLYVQGVNDVGPVKASMLASVEPVSAAVISAVWLKSEFAAMDIVGFGCILTTVFLLAKPEKPSE